MPKRFIIRKLKRYSCSRQGWSLKDRGYVFAIYDREWMKRAAHELLFGYDRDYADIKYIDSALKKQVAEFLAKWLNENKADCYDRKIIVPIDVFNKGLELYNKEA